MCTLTIPTICTIDTLTKVVGRIKQWHDCRANMGCVPAGQLKSWGSTAKNPETTTILPKNQIQNIHLHRPPPPPVRIAASIFRRRCLHCSFYPPRSLQIFANHNLGLASAGPLRISLENEGGGPVIGRLIAPCAAASIFRRRYHHCHWPFLWRWQWGWQW
jgi:hypothetical protein